MARALQISSADYPQFRKAVNRLLDSGELVNLKRGRIGLADQLNVAVGKLVMTRGGTGYLVREGKPVDIMIPQWSLGTALDGDKVMIRLTGEISGREAGTVIRVVERAPRRIVGVFKRGHAFMHVVPDNPRIHRDIYIDAAHTLDAQDGEKVVAKLTIWDDQYLNPEGEVVERIGFPGEPGVDMLTIIRTFDLPEHFPDEVIEAAELVAAEFSDEVPAERLDLTRECIYTIDPEDAKDHDDAVSVTRTETGYRLGVHIADVSHFVKDGSSLDLEAFNRGNSVYLPGIVIPMLPEVLSNDVCSLKADRNRLAHSTLIDFDKKGKMVKWQIVDAVIRSRAKLSYEQVQEYYDSGRASETTSPVADNLTVARELAQLLTKRRLAEGSLDFDLPEAKVILNPKGEVLELGSRIRLEAHRLVEEFMLAANRTVALEVFRNGQPFLYRVHDRPDMEKLEAFSLMVSKLGYKFPVSPNMKPALFARFLKQISDAPEADFINELMLRSMQKAVYQQANIGHFGLAFSHYTHFTSPIRRYPDLLVHRLLRKLKNRKYPPAFARRVGSIIDHVGSHCSETERSAESAERQAIKVKQVAYMANHLGEEYDGVISGVTPFGFFVRLANLGAEGLVRISTVDDDYYQFDEKGFRFVGSRRHRSFRLGDTIRVGVMTVNTIRGEIDLCVADLNRGDRVGKSQSQARTKVRAHPSSRKERTKVRHKKRVAK